MAKEWQNDSTLVSQIKRHEGCKLKPYKDSLGILTIGYGRNLESKGISGLEAELMLLNDIKEITVDLDSYIPWWRTLNEVSQRVLIDMGMMGVRKLLKFEQMLAYMRAGHYDMAASELINSKYASQTKTRAQNLYNMVRVSK